MKAALWHCFLGLLFLLVAFANTLAQGIVDCGIPGEGVLVRTGPKPLPIPLKNTDVKISVFGFVASVEVEQTFVNSFSENIEAVYVFPLPANAAVDDLDIVIGKRKIQGQIKEREEARQTYEIAKSAGIKAALLEQQRPNIFTSAVANIEPNSQIVVKIHYTERIAYDDGTFRLAFPMVVAPRYIPVDMQIKDGKIRKVQGGRLIPVPDKDKTVVPDADKITPPNLPANIRPGNISLSVELQAGFPIKKLQSITHEIKSDKVAPSHYRVQLNRQDEIPNRDFVLEYRIAGEQPEAAVMLATDQKGEGYFLMMAAPPSDFQTKDLVAKEMIFIVDTSGSMQGIKIEQAKNAMRSCLRGLNPQDDFNIIRFSSGFQPLWPKSQSVTQENINSADQFVNNFRAEGGTEMLNPLMHALQNNKAMPGQPAKARVIVFITDGQIGNEAQLLQAVKQNLGQTKIFTFGIDSAVNEYFLRKLAEIGAGTAEFLLPTQQNFETVINKFQSRISAPMLTNIAIDWGQMEVSDFYPNPVPDLYVNQPVFITGKIKATGNREQVFIKALSAVGLSTLPVLIDTSSSNIRLQAISALWARGKVDRLSNDLIETPNNQNIKQEITQLGLKHKLVTQFTSFIALEEKNIVPKEGGKPQTILVPVPVPADWQIAQDQDDESELEKARREATVQNFNAFGASGGARPGNAVPRMAEKRKVQPAPPSQPTPLRKNTMTSSKPASAANMADVSADQKAMAEPNARPAEMPADLKTGAKKDNAASVDKLGKATEREIDLSRAESKNNAKEEALADATVALDEVERYLGRNQAVSGAWADADRNVLRTTAMSTLAFVINGNTARKGIYQPQLRRSIELLTASIDANGVLRNKNGDVADTQTIAITLWAMSEIIADSPSANVSKAAEKLLTNLLKLRDKDGLWVAQEGGKADLNATAWVVLALESAKKANLSFDQSLISSGQEALAKGGTSKIVLANLVKELNLTASQPIAQAAARYLLLSQK